MLKIIIKLFTLQIYLYSFTIVVKKSSLEENIWSKNYTLDNFNRNLTQVIMNANKVIHENFIAVR